MNIINRRKENIIDVLYSQHLCCYPPENQAAKLFVEWLKNNPEVSPDDVDMKINSVEREEDYYGNGGGVDNTMIIYKTREESDANYNTRIKEQEELAINEFIQKIHFDVADLIHKYNIYPNLYSDAISAHEKEIEDAIREVVINKIKNKK